VGDRPRLSAENRCFGPVGSVREEEPREALRGRKSWKNRPPAEGRLVSIKQEKAPRMARRFGSVGSMDHVHNRSWPKALRWCPALPEVFRARRASLRSSARTEPTRSKPRCARRHKSDSPLPGTASSLRAWRSSRLGARTNVSGPTQLPTAVFQYSRKERKSSQKRKKSAVDTETPLKPKIRADKHIGFLP